MVAQLSDAYGAAVPAGAPRRLLAGVEALIAAEDVGALEADFGVPDAVARIDRKRRAVARDAGCEAAFTVFMNDYERRVGALLHRYLRLAADVDEARQDVFAEMWACWDPAKSGDERRALLFRVTRNRAIDVFRSREYKLRRQTVPETALDDACSAAPEPPDQVERDERIAAVRRVLAALPADQRQLVVARYYDGVPFDDLAAAQRTTSGALRTKDGRIRDKLRRRLTEAGVA